MLRVASVLCCIIALILTGCATPRFPAYADLEANAPYTLGSGDRVRVLVFGQDSLSNSYAVDSSGHVSLPLIGPVMAQGLTPAGLARAIEDHLRNGYLREPKVSVEVEAFRPFFILGEVTSAGQYPYVNGMTVETAVAIAGGFTPRAYKSAAELTRDLNGQPVRGSVPVTMPVRPGDTIVIHERYF